MHRYELDQFSRQLYVSDAGLSSRPHYNSFLFGLLSCPAEWLFGLTTLASRVLVAPSLDTVCGSSSEQRGSWSDQPRAWHSHWWENHGESGMVRKRVVFRPQSFFYFCGEQNCVLDTEPNCLLCVTGKCIPCLITRLDSFLKPRGIPYPLLKSVTVTRV